MSERLSGDRFGPVSADYFHGLRVQAVEEGDKAEGSPVWSIVFEGGSRIDNYELEVPTPKAIVGQAHTKTILEAQRTRLFFGLEEVVLNPMKYSITDANYTQGHEVFPQTSDYNEIPLPPDPSPDRVVDGPTG